MTVIGIDVAHYQSTADYRAILPAQGFLIAKATEGTAVDYRFGAHIIMARAFGVPIIGAYHFGRDDVNVASQVAKFLASAGDLDCYALDVEGAHYFSAAQGREFIDRMHLAGKKIGLYASESGYPEWGQDWNWIANYSREPRHRYDIWQYGPAAPNVDGDRYRGTIDELKITLGLQEAVSMKEFTPSKIGPGTATVVGPDHAVFSLTDPTDYIPVTDGQTFEVYGFAALAVDINPGPGNRRSFYIVKAGTPARAYGLLSDPTNSKFTPAPAPADASPFTQADVDEKVRVAVEGVAGAATEAEQLRIAKVLGLKV